MENQLFILCFISLFYIWIGYPMLLMIWEHFVDDMCHHQSLTKLPLISVVIAAHNEADNIEERIEDIYNGKYPNDLIEVVIASDGSTDSTIEICNRMSLKYPLLKSVDIKPQLGRSNAHNKALDHCNGEILVFSDAETILDANCLLNLVNAFANPTIGFASGTLLFGNTNKNEVTKSVGIYWQFEMRLRQLESKLGIYAFGSGACCAVRKSLYREISPIGDVDFITPIDVVLQGYKCVHVAHAEAYDVLPGTPEKEFRARIRMTAKNMHGTIQRWGLTGIYQHPVYTWVLISHKIGRWITPFILLGLLISTLLCMNMGGIYTIILGIQMLFYSYALLGGVGVKLPLAGQVYSFLIANVAFAIGVLKAIFGQVPSAYKPVAKID